MALTYTEHPQAAFFLTSVFSFPYFGFHTSTIPLALTPEYIARATNYYGVNCPGDCLLWTHLLHGECCFFSSSSVYIPIFLHFCLSSDSKIEPLQHLASISRLMALTIPTHWQACNSQHSQLAFRAKKKPSLPEINVNPQKGGTCVF